MNDGEHYQYNFYCSPQTLSWFRGLFCNQYGHDQRHEPWQLLLTEEDNSKLYCPGVVVTEMLRETMNVTEEQAKQMFDHNLRGPNAR